MVLWFYSSCFNLTLYLNSMPLLDGKYLHPDIASYTSEFVLAFQRLFLRLIQPNALKSKDHSWGETAPHLGGWKQKQPMTYGWGGCACSLRIHSQLKLTIHIFYMLSIWWHIQPFLKPPPHPWSAHTHVLFPHSQEPGHRTCFCVDVIHPLRSVPQNPLPHQPGCWVRAATKIVHNSIPPLPYWPNHEPRMFFKYCVVTGLCGSFVSLEQQSVKIGFMKSPLNIWTLKDRSLKEKAIIRRKPAMAQIL